MARSRNNPRKIASIQPVGAGRMAAQQPAASANLQKQSTLARDLETVKRMVQGGVRLVLTSDSPYLVDEGTDDYIFVNAIDGAVTVYLQLGDEPRQKRLSVFKTDASVNVVTVSVSPAAPFGDIEFEGAGRLAVLLNAQAASVTLLRAGSIVTGWWTLASSGNVTF